MASDRKTLLLTGASGGLGRAIIPVLHNAGFHLVLQANTRVDELRNFVQERHFENVSVIRHSLANAEEVKAFAELVGEEIDVLVANAGISLSAAAHKVRTDDWKKTLDINLSVPFYLAQSLFAGMRKRNFGRIIFISSVVANTLVRGTAAYAASKAGLQGLARALAADWAPFGITVNCIAPGYMQAGMISDIPPEILPQFTEKSVQKRLGPPEEIGHAVVYLASQESSFMTGQTLHINGGIF
jgi:3-oxoacyl-[acyl-carrier protein] reductase